MRIHFENQIIQMK